MSTSLYQKYRPQTFADIVGQEHVRTTLLNEITNKTVAHSYLFSGSRGIGKTSTARLLARAINCEQPKAGEPCNECNHCTLVINGTALDVVEIDAASHTGVDNVRENIIENARVAPSVLPWKVFVIDEVHMLSTSAFNALLKTIEEPPANTLFVLATTELHKVPATIVSRCERFNFHRIGFTQMVERLKSVSEKEGVKVDDEVLHAIAKRSEGALRDAESLLGQVISLDDTHVTSEVAEMVLPHSSMSEVIGLWDEIVRGQSQHAITRVNRLVQEGVVLSDFVQEMVEFSRTVLLYQVQQTLETLQYTDLSNEDTKKITEMAGNIAVADQSRVIQYLMKAQEQGKSATIPQLPLELAIIALTDPKRGAPLHKVAGGVQAPVPTVAPTVEPAAVEQPAPAEPEPQPEEPEPQPAPVPQVAETVVPAPAPEPEAPTQPEPQPEPEVPATPAPAQETPEEDAAPPASGNLTLAHIQAKWETVLSEMQKANHALYLSCKVGQLVSYETPNLTLGFEYQFYQDRLADAQNAPVIEKVLTEVFGEKIIVDTVVGKEYAVKTSTDHTNIEQPSEEEVASVWELAEQTFGSQPVS